jgi:hypothetical protein
LPTNGSFAFQKVAAVKNAPVTSPMVRMTSIPL